MVELWEIPVYLPFPEEIENERRYISETMDEMGDGKIEQLIFEAVVARENAYVSYSYYKVGASLLTANDKLYRGCNSENVNYTNTIHAEQAALSNAISAGEAVNNRRFLKALSVITDSDDPSGPCGLCRQSMLEHADNCLVFEANPKGEIQFVTSLKLLIPKAFTPSHLGIE